MADAADPPEPGQAHGVLPVTGDAVGEEGAPSPFAPSMPVLHLEGFDGPMDLLLDLAERQRIDLGRLSIQGKRCSAAVLQPVE